LILNERIIEDDVLKKLILGTDLKSEEITSSPHVVSQVFGEFTHSNFTNLADIFPAHQATNPSHHPSGAQLNSDKNYFKVKVTVLGILPMNLRELT
jgi:hypothetical protein